VELILELQKYFIQKNGIHLGVAFRNFLEEPLFPTVGLRTPGEIVDANFGESPFIFNFSALAKAEKKLFTKHLPLVEENVTDSLLENVLQYLSIHGYSNTATALAKSTGKSFETCKNFDKRLRKAIIEGITNFDIEAVQDMLLENYPTFLPSNQSLEFEFHCLIFLEFLSKKGTMTALDYGIKNLSAYNNNPAANEKLLKDAFSLLVYSNPAESSMKYLLEKKFRETFAFTVIRALLIFLGNPVQAPLERLLIQGGVVQEEMLQLQVPLSCLMFENPALDANFTPCVTKDTPD